MNLQQLINNVLSANALSRASPSFSIFASDFSAFNVTSFTPEVPIRKKDTASHPAGSIDL